uniref:SepOvotropin n=1 Tax=Sepia officinalis TaxID=6610 RepID=SOVO_SEPOF|nr:RecName: Full=SepOvotropin [Sepia officinalis]
PKDSMLLLQVPVY